uniref:Coiled-coil domain-containing protein 86 n=1 Tax=Leptocylindrus danicus TaxID=163516 RepID=A0A7S2K541_9STRA|eukprot:CAMPEP_0116049504 /NCGR_PEP_ID=MMETSP0321-20121206/30201_1 /TAXON_ID=163516 /ORGANISM="Leptocylindrus danicus var. danicus, Strain B650" /LENGTH=163 /DNA_ID=CAMNT_0003531937 /DNA_START=18 /DNA_END=509 /DNA_ORIENTATION=+
MASITAEATPTPTRAVAEEKKADTKLLSFAEGGKGRNTSGRNWKQQPKKRFSSLIHTKKNNLTKSWARHLAEKEQRKKIKEKEQEIKDETRRLAIEKKERRVENERRRAENEFKHASASAQTLNLDTVGHKMKAMNKKQLRMIKKTRMNTKTGVVEYVPAYAK